MVPLTGGCVVGGIVHIYVVFVLGWGRRGDSRSVVSVVLMVVRSRVSEHLTVYKEPLEAEPSCRRMGWRTRRRPDTGKGGTLDACCRGVGGGGVGARGGRESGKLSAWMKPCAVNKVDTKDPFALCAQRMYVGPGLVSETAHTLCIHCHAPFCRRCIV